jgi:hypothetical protein
MATYALSGYPKFKMVSGSTATPVVGGYVYTYAAGTTTPATTYADNLGSTPNANPIVLDSNGEASIFLNTANLYKYVITDGNVAVYNGSQYGAILETIDNIAGSYTPAGGSYIYDPAGNLVLSCLAGSATPVSSLSIYNEVSGTNILIAATGGTSNGINFRDSNNNVLLNLNSVTSGVNGVSITNATSSNPPLISATGTANIGLKTLDSNGNGLLSLISVASAANYLQISNNTTGGNVLLSNIGGTNAGFQFFDASSAAIATLKALGIQFFAPVTIQKASTNNTLTIFGSDGSSSILTASSSNLLTLTNNFSVGGTLVVTSTASTGALTVTSGGAAITGNSTVTGTLGVSSTLTVTAGGAAITGTTGITGATTVTGNLTVTGTANIGFPADGRLTLTSGVPVTTADVTGAGTLYYTPYIGNRIAIYTGSAWEVLTFAQISIAVPAVGNQMYDVFVFDSSGSATLVLTAWTNDTTRATALVYQNGVLVQSGSTGRRYVGSFRTLTASQTESSVLNRLVWNYYNRVTRATFRAESTASWTYTTDTWHQANASTSNQITIVQGVAEDPVEMQVLALAQNATSGIYTPVGLGIDSTTVNSSFVTNGGNAIALGQGSPTAAIYRNVEVAGFHTYVWLERSQAVGTTTWSGSEYNMLSGMVGSSRG